MTKEKNKKNQVLAIGLDAADPYLIEKWMNEGYLKNLAALRAKGSFGKLSSSADWLVGSPWVTFYTGIMPGEHGIYHYLQWRSDKMDYERPNPDWISVTPFWRTLDKSIRVIAVDIPLTFPPTQINGIEISGWASHDRIFPASSYPANKMDWVIKNFGKSPISDEVGGLQQMGELIATKEELVNANKKEADLLTTLIKNEEWDLFLGCFTATHRGGHKFWDLTNIKGEFSKKQEEDFRNCLREIYQSCDEEIGRLMENISSDVTVLIFSLHGMGVNTTLTDKMLPNMISNIINEKKETNSNSGIVKKIRNFIPLEWRSNLRKLLPVWLQDKMTAYWRMGNIDWSKTKVFSMVADLQGYIRINLKGRERDGIVEIEEYDEICDKLIKGLKTFVDAETLEPVIESIEKSANIFKKGKGFNNLPDILVKWKNRPASSYNKIISKEYGEVEWPMPGFNPDGRSGNHRPEGFLLASGEHITRNSNLNKNHIVDLAPTILHLLGSAIPGHYEGKIMEEILKSEVII